MGHNHAQGHPTGKKDLQGVGMNRLKVKQLHITSFTDHEVDLIYNIYLRGFSILGLQIQH